MIYVEVTINKPLFGTFCYIRSKYIDQARRLNIPLKITIPQGTAIVSVDEWMDGAKKMVKEFKIKDKPMILFGNFVPIPVVEAQREAITGIGLEQLSLI